MPSRRTLVRAVVASCSLLLLYSATAGAQQCDTDDLLSRGTVAYNELPANVTLLDAPKFSEALGYLYAYEQCMNRKRQSVDAQTQAALGWMLRNIAAMSSGKADEFRSDEQLHDRGMAMYRKTRASESDGVVWDVPAFLSAATNLFAYGQVAPHPDADATSAHAWLVQSQGRLVKSAGRGDDPRSPDGWLPSGKRPGAAGVARDEAVHRSRAERPTRARPPTRAMPSPAPPPPPPPAPASATPGGETSAQPHTDADSSVEVPVFFATSRAATGAAAPDGMFGGDRDNRPLHYGQVSISIPPNHRPGELERPGRLLFFFHRSENPAKHVLISRLDTLNADEWLRRVQQTVASSSEKEMLVYLHGYNVPFDDAMRRAGQLGYDLGYENGTIAAFSWPSLGNPAEYAADAANAEWTGPALERFLTRLADSTGAQRISVIAHSMGNRALASVLRTFASRSQPAFSELVLAAPDLDADVFEQQIAPILGKSARHSTLYVSADDRALDLSRRLHEHLRAGSGGPRIFGLTELDIVDATNVPAGSIDHSYYAENKEVLDDIFMLVRRGLPPEQRNLRKVAPYDHAWRLP
jgi:esterase/lipase superfamily enzyme